MDTVKDPIARRALLSYWKAENKYWRKVRRSILAPLPLLYRQPTIYGVGYHDMSLWQLAASFREQKRAWNNVIQEQVQDLRARVVELRRRRRG